MPGVDVLGSVGLSLALVPDAKRFPEVALSCGLDPLSTGQVSRLRSDAWSAWFFHLGHLGGPQCITLNFPGDR